MKRKLKVIVSAYGCHPEQGSEAGVGWNWVKEIAKYHEVFVLIYAGKGQKEAVSQAVSLLDCKENIHIVPISVDSFFQKYFYRLRYEIWQIKAFFVSKEIIKKENIDIIHSVTIASWWFSGYFWKLKLPFIFGPISGGQKVDKKSMSYLPLKAKIYELFRNAIVKLSFTFCYNPRKALRSADLVLAANYETLELTSKVRKKKTLLFTEIGVNSVHPKERSSNENVIRLLWAGRLISSKNFDLLFDSLKEIPQDINWELLVAGDGKLKPYWQEKVLLYGLKEKVRFLGNVKFTEMEQLYKKADIFVFPSIREATGSVLLEAMSYGLPVIAMDINGAKVILDESCGILIKIKERKETIVDFKNAILNLYYDSELRYSLGQAAIKKVEENLLWSKRGETMCKIYSEVINASKWGVSPN